MSQATLRREYSADRTITQHDLDTFAAISGDDNPIHVDAEYAATTTFGRPVAHGMFLFSLVRAELRRHWPTAQLSEQQLRFTAPTPVDSVVTIRITVIDTDGKTRRAATTVTSSDGSVGLDGECLFTIGGGR